MGNSSINEPQKRNDLEEDGKLNSMSVPRR